MNRSHSTETDTGLTTMPDGRQHISGLLPDLIFGPVDSRRYGRSLGVNPIPRNEKVCSFDCPYCECGWTTRLRLGIDRSLAWPDVGEILSRLEQVLQKTQSNGESLDAVTFAGNGEPTLHPEFPELIRETRRLRDQYHPSAKVVVLTNGSELGRPDIRESLLSVDEACVKLDAVSPELMKRVNLPHGEIDFERIIQWLKDFPSPIVQTMFVEGSVDNTEDSEISAWLQTLKEIRPRRVDVYTLDRTPPDPGLKPVPAEKLQRIARLVKETVGVPAEVY